MTGFLNLTVSGVSIWAKLPYDFYIVHVVIIFCFRFCCVSTLYTLVRTQNIQKCSPSSTFYRTLRDYSSTRVPFLEDYNAQQTSYLFQTSKVPLVVKRTCQNMAAARGYITANTSKIGGNWIQHITCNHGCMVFQPVYWIPKHIKRKNIQTDFL